MANPERPSANVFGVECPLDPDDPPGYRSGMAKIGAAVGGRDIAVRVSEVHAGESVCPYHYRCDSDVYHRGHGLGTDRDGSFRHSA
jgi:hypothetical protein